MSGHSKWAQIKHKKAITDSRKGQAYTKLANMISVAARAGADPATNFKLRLAVQKAKEEGMPNANIERSIAKGSGQLGGQVIEEIVYEGYGPGGIAIMIETATDNRNRTVADVRSTLSKHGGRLGETGSVAFQFIQRGVVVVKPADFEQAELDAIETGAEDFEQDSDALLIYTKPTELELVRKNLVDAGYEVESAELSYVSQSRVLVTDAKVAEQIIRLMTTLEELDDVTATNSNFEIDEKIATSIS